MSLACLSKVGTRLNSRYLAELILERGLEFIIKGFIAKGVQERLEMPSRNFGEFKFVPNQGGRMYHFEAKFRKKSLTVRGSLENDSLVSEGDSSAELSLM